jgi:hypothetical protein
MKEVSEILDALGGCGAAIGRTELVSAAIAADATLLVEALGGMRHGLASHEYDPELTALQWAAVLGLRGLCLTMLDLGVPIDDRGSFGMTPLHWACLLGHTETARALVWANADIESEFWGVRPLYMATLCNHASVVEMLVRRGADVGAVSASSGKTALMYAHATGNHRVLAVLERSKPDDDDDELMRTCAYHIFPRNMMYLRY